MCQRLKSVNCSVNCRNQRSRCRSILQLSACTVAWLKTAKKRKGPLVWNRQQLRRARRALCKSLKIKWHQDLMRKTAASYQLALSGDAAGVAYKLGTSERALSRWYIDGLVTKEDAEKFYAIVPSSRPQARRARKPAVHSSDNRK